MSIRSHDFHRAWPEWVLQTADEDDFLEHHNTPRSPSVLVHDKAESINFSHDERISSSPAWTGDIEIS